MVQIDITPQTIRKEATEHLIVAFGVEGVTQLPDDLLDLMCEYIEKKCIYPLYIKDYKAALTDAVGDLVY